VAAFTYIIECADGTLYTGWTTDLENRIAVHNSGKGAKYTRGRGPVKLVYYEQYDNNKTAQVRECQIKKLKRKEKEELVLQQASIQQYDKQ
jgi:putative endonuclease